MAAPSSIDSRHKPATLPLASSGSELPFTPTTAITSPDNYGGLNPENENTVGVIAGESGSSLRRYTRLSDDNDSGQQSSLSMQESKRHDFRVSSSVNMQCAPPLLLMPTEIVDGILGYLDPFDLTTVSAVCRSLRSLATSDTLWQRLVQQNIPGPRISRSYPCNSFRELYAAHDLKWFLPRYKIWFSDRDMTGKLVVARYDQFRGCIEGLQVLATTTRTAFGQWPADSHVIVHSFQPSVMLHQERPVFQFCVGDGQEDGGFSDRAGANRFADEMPISLDERAQGVFSNFSLTKSLDHNMADEMLEDEYPYGDIWPPPAVPSRHHVTGFPWRDDMMNSGARHRPLRRAQVSDKAFRIRRWLEMAGGAMHPSFQLRQMGGFHHTTIGGATRGMGGMSVHMGEEILTFSTLDPKLYTPTPTKPWRGIWVGDYSGHGCEFLLVHQPDDEPASDEELGLHRGLKESSQDWEQRRLDARIYRGRLEAIKLTGDPNVPRGEYTFLADDLGPAGYVGDAIDELFKGARKVKSKGHVAQTGFISDKFVESQLLLVSHDRLAQYWIGFGHISFFERVDIDALLDPTRTAAV